MSQIIVKNNGIKVFQRDFVKTEENIVQLIKDMSLKGIISLKEFKQLYNEAFDETIQNIKETKDIFVESGIETKDIFVKSGIEIIKGR